MGHHPGRYPGQTDETRQGGSSQTATGRERGARRATRCPQLARSTTTRSAMAVSRRHGGVEVLGAAVGQGHDPDDAQDIRLAERRVDECLAVAPCVRAAPRRRYVASRPAGGRSTRRRGGRRAPLLAAPHRGRSRRGADCRAGSTETCSGRSPRSSWTVRASGTSSTSPSRAVTPRVGDGHRVLAMCVVDSGSGPIEPGRPQSERGHRAGDRAEAGAASPRSRAPRPVCHGRARARSRRR